MASRRLGKKRPNVAPNHSVSRRLGAEPGIPADLLPIARVCRCRLTGVEYVRLRGAGLVGIDALHEAKVDDLVDLLGADKPKARLS